MSTEPVPIPPTQKPKPVAASPVAPPPAKHPNHQLHDPNLRPYRPKFPPRKPLEAESKRACFSCSCCCCCLVCFVMVLVVLAAAITAAGTLFWVLYQPELPRFTVASLRLTNLTLTGNLDTDASGHLFTAGNLTVSAKNPNSRIAIFYDEIAMGAFSAHEVQIIANSTLPGFESAAGNSTVMKFEFTNSRMLDFESAKGLRADLARRSEVGVKVVMEMKMRVEIGKWRSRGMEIKVTCLGVRVGVPKKKVVEAAPSPASEPASLDGGRCRVFIMGITQSWILHVE